MRVTREQAGKNREAVLGVASRMFRQSGFDGVGIADIMKAAGLTHGGFYGQFSSKEQLEVEASRRALESGSRKWRRVLADAEGDPIEALADFYLRPAHRADFASGCALPALAADAARGGENIRDAFSSGVADYLSSMEAAMAARSNVSGEPRRDAMAALSTLVGALLLSRAVADPALSDAILAAAKTSLPRKPDG